MMIALMFLCTTALMFWRAFAISLAWSWHMTSLGLPEITILKSFGLLLVFRLFLRTSYSDSEKEWTYKRIGKETGLDAALTAFLLLLAWLVS